MLFYVGSNDTLLMTWSTGASHTLRQNCQTWRQIRDPKTPQKPDGFLCQWPTTRIIQIGGGWDSFRQVCRWRGGIPLWHNPAFPAFSRYVTAAYDSLKKNILRMYRSWFLLEELPIALYTPPCNREKWRLAGKGPICPSKQQEQTKWADTRSIPITSNCWSRKSVRNQTQAFFFFETFFQSIDLETFKGSACSRLSQHFIKHEEVKCPQSI